MTNQQDYIPLPFHDRKFDISLSEKISRVDLTRKTQDSRGTHDSRTTTHDPILTTFNTQPTNHDPIPHLPTIHNPRPTTHLPT